MDQPKLVQAKFNPGKLVATRAAMKAMDPDYAVGALQQHVQAQWGILDKEDWDANNAALKNGGRIMSVYPLPNDPGPFYVVTEADRSVTTILLPSEY